MNPKLSEPILLKHREERVKKDHGSGKLLVNFDKFLWHARKRPQFWIFGE